MPKWLSLLLSLFHVKPVQNVVVQPQITPPPVQLPQAVAPIPAVKYLFDTVQNSQHSVRVICDEMGLNLYEKSVIYACIEQESNFENYRSSNVPTVCHNYKTDEHGAYLLDTSGQKILLSTDWGICQINDTKNWYIGPAPLPFSSVDFVLANPEKAVRFMIRMALQKDAKGQSLLDRWVSYKSGAYKKFMPQNLRDTKGRF